MSSKNEQLIKMQNCHPRQHTCGLVRDHLDWKHGQHGKNFGDMMHDGKETPLGKWHPNQEKTPACQWRYVYYHKCDTVCNCHGTVMKLHKLCHTWFGEMTYNPMALSKDDCGMPIDRIGLMQCTLILVNKLRHYMMPKAKKWHLKCNGCSHLNGWLPLDIIGCMKTLLRSLVCWPAQRGPNYLSLWAGKQDQLHTFGWVVATLESIAVKGWGSLWGNPAHSYWLKAFGNIAAMLWLWESTKFYGIKRSKAITSIECDNLGLCTNKKKKIDDKTPNPDTIHLMHEPDTEMLGKVVHGHIKGHQDKIISKDALPWLAQLNIWADKLTHVPLQGDI